MAVTGRRQAVGGRQWCRCRLKLTASLLARQARCEVLVAALMVLELVSCCCRPTRQQADPALGDRAIYLPEERRMGLRTGATPWLATCSCARAVIVQG